MAMALVWHGAALAVTVTVDAKAKVHPINPLIYGVAFASTDDLFALNAPLNRFGGNATTTYSYANNAQNLAYDWYFESYPQSGEGKGDSADRFIAHTTLAGSQPIVTIPLIGWVAKLGPGRAILPSFSIAKYGKQCDHDYWDHDAGNGLKSDCSTPISNNDPNDAYVVDTPANEKVWVSHLLRRWGPAAGGGVGYYAMDNEASIWYSTHRDIHPIGPHADEYRDKVVATSAVIKAVDPNAKIMAPEEWGWAAYRFSGYDQQYSDTHGYTYFPDWEVLQKKAWYIPWLLQQWKSVGHPVDVLSVHFYPQGGEYGDDVSTNMQLLRNRSTRQLWDPHYISESWIGAPVRLIPLLKQWVSKYYYANTPVAITEYNWGAEGHINGATAQADIYGIFGQQGLDMATRWTVPAAKTPTYKAMQMYRNYDGAGSAFGDMSVSTAGPNPDNLSAFAALRSADGALTVMVVNKVLSGSTALSLAVSNFQGAGIARVYQLTSSNRIRHLTDKTVSGSVLTDTLPAQSITLYVLPKAN
jgi:hypothetical protein